MSAATTFFEQVSIGDRSFGDGGLGANNPVDQRDRGRSIEYLVPRHGELESFSQVLYLDWDRES